MGRPKKLVITKLFSDDEIAKRRGTWVEESDINQLEDGSIKASAKVDCELFNEKFGNIIPEGKFETLGGYIISEIGRIPNKGETLYLSIGQINISQSSSRQINQVIIILKK